MPKVVLKRSSVSSNAPTTSDLDYGELAINYADGKLYYKTSSNTIDYFSSDAAGGNSEFENFQYTATASQTTFSGADDNSNSLSYLSGQLTVYINGIKLAESDYTATNGTSVVLASAATLNDLVEIVSYINVRVATYIYTATSSQTTFSGTDDNSKTLAYTPGRITVFLNGIKLAEGDYTATNGTSVVLGSGAALNDVFEVVAYRNLNVAEIDASNVTTTATQTLTNKTISGSDNTLSNIGNASLTNSSVTINSNSLSLGGTLTLDTDDISEGVTNVYYTDARAQAAISVTDSGGDGSLSYNSGTGVITYTGPSASEVRAHLTAGTGLTVTNGEFAIDSTVATLTGSQTLTNKTLTSPVISSISNTGTLTLPTSTGTVALTSDITLTTLSVTATAAELNVLDGITATTTELNYTDGVTSNIQTQLDAKAPLASPAFTGTATGVNLTLSGDLTVNGTTTTLSTTNTVIEDNLIELNNGAASNANDSGIVIERGSTGDNAFMGWDESEDAFVLGTTTATGASTGNLTITPGEVHVGSLGIGTTSPTTQLHVSGSGTQEVRITSSTGNPVLRLDNASGYVSYIQWNSAGSAPLTFYDATTSTERMRIDSSGNVGIGTTSPATALHLIGALTMGNSTYSRPALTSTNWGYSASYRVMMIGSTSTVYNTNNTGAVTVAFNYDPSSNANGSFGGDGREILFRRGTQFVTPNSADNSYYLYNLVLLDGNVGIGTANPAQALHVTGQILATSEITAYYSDERLKTKVNDVTNALDIVSKLNPFRYVNNELAESFGFENDHLQIGLSAQEVQKVAPEIVKLAPFDQTLDENGNVVSKSGENYLTLDYAKLVPILIQAIKEQQEQINELKKNNG